jgi:hypothetical protein
MSELDKAMRRHAEEVAARQGGVAVPDIDPETGEIIGYFIEDLPEPTPLGRNRVHELRRAMAREAGRTEGG